MFDSTFESIYLAGTIVAGAIRIKYTRGRSRDDIVVDRRTRIDVLVVTLTGMGVILPLLYFSTPWFDFADYHLPPWAAWLGVLAFALSLWLLWRSHAELGRHWSNYARIKQDHTLVKSGVYRCIRHPMYSAHWHWAVAQALLIWNWLAGFGMLLAKSACSSSISAMSIAGI